MKALTFGLINAVFFGTIVALFNLFFGLVVFVFFIGLGIKAMKA
jgi:hypothetical protein